MGILIDASGSIYSHYQDYLNVLQKIVQHFPISTGLNRVGLVSMANGESNVIGLPDHMTSASFVKSLKTLPQPEGKSNMASSLQTAYYKIFTGLTVRADVPKVLVVMSDGFKNDETDGGKTAVQWADEIESFGIKVCYCYVILVLLLVCYSYIFVLFSKIKSSPDW